MLSTPVSSSGAEPGATGDTAYSAELRTTARWLVSASAAASTVLVAGLQLRNLDGMDAVGWWGVPASLGAVLAALSGFVVTLRRASSVLAAPRHTISELDWLDRADNGAGPPHSRVREPVTGLIKYLVVERRTELLGGSRDSIWNLTQELGAARQALMSSRPATINRRRYDPALSADSAALAALRDDMQDRIQHVVAAAEAWETKARFNRLHRTMAWTIPVFVSGVLAFAWLTTLPTKTMPVKTPIQVTVIMPAHWRPPACSGKTLTGVAVGGTLDAPMIRTPAQQGCPAQKISDTRNITVIPALRTKADTS